MPIMHDEKGAWYVWKGNREPAILRTCQACGKEFYTRRSQPQRWCSSKCAQFVPPPPEMLTAKPPTSLRTRSGNARYVQDEHGWWWYIHGEDARRVRCKVCRCKYCGDDFIASPFRAKGAQFCSRQCGARGKGAPSGPDHARWRGGRRVQNGYITVWAPDHPSREGKKKKYVLEHRLVMERHLGRLLKQNESVHHRNGDKQDNRVENLELFATSGHVRGASAPHCSTCTCFDQ